jgi:hypothetical protein
MLCYHVTCPKRLLKALTSFLDHIFPRMNEAQETIKKESKNTRGSKTGQGLYEIG